VQVVSKKNRSWIKWLEIVLVVVALILSVAAQATESRGAETTAPRLYRVIIPVRDIEAAVKFYSELFQSEGERVSPGRHYFNLGGTVFAVYDPTADGDVASEWKYHPYQYVYIGVSDVDAILKRAGDLGATLVTNEVELMPWGERLFYALDPFGTPICFVDSKTLFTGDSD